jgi:UDP-glucose 4-epimerase
VTSDAATTTWVIGAGGLLGRAVVTEAERAGHRVHRTAVPWIDNRAAVDTLVRDAHELSSSGARLHIAWCAGAGVVGTDRDALARELELLDRFLDRLVHIAGSNTDHGSSLSLFFASSAGGVYAASDTPPFTEKTLPRPNSPYGEAKLAAERLVRQFAEAARARAFIGRIANLYGPGQDMSKQQGLISQMCRSHLTRQPLVVYVSLDTARDYLYVVDAARMIVAGLDLLEEARPGTAVVKILAAQRSTTIAAILGELTRIGKRRPQIVLGKSPNARFQTRDLRFRSVQWPELDRSVTTPLPAGLFATFHGVATELNRPRQ